MDVLIIAKTAINVFVIPSIAFVGCARKGLLDEKVPLLMQYSSITAMLYTLATVILKFVNILLSTNLGDIYCIEYAVIAVSLAIVYPLLYCFTKEYISVVLKKEEKNGQ